MRRVDENGERFVQRFWFHFDDTIKMMSLFFHILFFFSTMVFSKNFMPLRRFLSSE